MINNKRLLIGVAMAIIIAVSISAVSATGFNLLNFKKIEGNKQPQEGVFVDLPTRKDKQSVVDSIEPKTGAPTWQLQAKANDKNVFTKILVTEDSGKKVDFPYVKENNKDVLIYDPVKTLWTVPIPGTNDYLIAFDGTIYRSDWENGKLKKFLQDEVNGYKKDEVLSQSIEGIGTPLWGSNPYVNPNGKYLLFYSDRSMVKGNLNGEMWIKNIETGDERPVLSRGAGVVGWLNDNTVILSTENIILLNVETGEVKKLLDGAYDVKIIKDQLFYQTAPGCLTFLSTLTGEKMTVTHTLLHRAGSIQARGSWIALENQVRDGDPEVTVLLYNIDSNTWKSITAPANTWIEGISWKDDSTLLIKSSIKETMDEATYVVE